MKQKIEGGKEYLDYSKIPRIKIKLMAKVVDRELKFTDTTTPIQDISQCPNCLCMTKTVKGKCGKCKEIKSTSIQETEKKCDVLNHDFKHLKRFGRADWRCPKCGENVILLLVFAYQAGIDLTQ